MKKIKSNNWYYLAGILPFVFLMYLIAIVRLDSMIWKIVASIICIFILVAIIKKFLYVPYGLSQYGEMEEIVMKLPIKWNIKIYACQEMDRYSFLNRKVEIFSPLFSVKGRKTSVMVSPSFLKTYKRQFVEICIVREIIKYVQKVQIKLILGLLIPILTWITFLEAFFLMGWKKVFDEYSGVTNFFGPILTAAIIIITLFIWNHSVSVMDYKMDAWLKQYYSQEEIVDYIKKWDEIMLPDEKELIKDEKREVELHYIRERIERLQTVTHSPDGVKIKKSKGGD